MKLKLNEKIDKYWDLARELRKLRNMKVTVIPILSNCPQKPDKGNRGIGDHRKNQ